MYYYIYVSDVKNRMTWEVDNRPNYEDVIKLNNFNFGKFVLHKLDYTQN